MSATGGVSRRGVVLGAGAVGAASVLAACESDEPGGASQNGATSDGGNGTSSGGESPDAEPASIPVAHVPVGGGYIDFDHRVVVTQPEAGQFRAFDANCTHAHCLVTFIDRGVIMCPCHGSEFRIADGSVANGPATESLRTRTATVSGDVIVVS